LLCSRKMLLFLLSFQLILTKRRLCMRQWTALKKKGKCFPFFNRRKTLSFGYVAFFSLTGIQFLLTTFSDYCQTWKKQESEFQEFTFLQSNTAKIMEISSMI
jgi:hypothetical protein